jgi:hypothetical protein
MTERENTDEIRTRCKALFDRLYLPTDDPNKMTAAELEAEMKKMMGKYGVKVIKVQKAPVPAVVQQAREILGGDRGCPPEADDPDGPAWNS